MTGVRAPRPAHQITPEEVDAWLAGSVVKTITYHHPDPAPARSVITSGVDLSTASPDARWGAAFYSSTIPDPQYGSTAVPVAVRFLNPLVIHPHQIGDLVQLDLIEETDLATIREAVLVRGHDGVVIH